MVPIAANRSANCDQKGDFLGRKNRKNTPKNGFGATAIVTYVDWLAQLSESGIGSQE